MRTMYDSITAADIPASAQLVAGYIDMSSRWSAADWTRFPGATLIRIARSASTNDGHVLDVERYLALPAEAPGWVQMRRSAGVDPTVYCNASALGAVQAAFAAAGVPEPHYWIAHYDNAPTVPAGVVAKQYINDPASGGHYDLSAVADYWPGVDPASIPLSKEDDMPDRPLLPTTGKDACATLIVPKTATELVVSVGWVRMYVSKLAFFGPTNPAGLNQLTVPVGSPGDKPFPIDAARSWEVPVPAGAVTAEITYSMPADPNHDTTGVVGFR